MDNIAMELYEVWGAESVVIINLAAIVSLILIVFLLKNKKKTTMFKIDNRINTEKAKSILKEYTDGLKLPEEIEPRILNMYLKEMEHILSMNESAKLLKPFRKIWYGTEFDSNEFLVKNEEELTNKAIENVNKIFRKFI